MPIESGTQLGPYEILTPLAAGGMGEIYRARDTRLDREVAVKVLPEQLAKNPDMLARFDRETKALAALSHPNILTIYDCGIIQDLSYAVMELLEGETLRERIERSPLPWERALEIAIAVAEALSAAHSKGIIHRDLKPENIFLSTNNVVKILDFGLVHLEFPPEISDVSSAATDPALSHPGMLLGTVGYMSPEQARGLEIDARTDIFSFGCTLFEMLSGIKPFSRATFAETMAAILKEEPGELNGSDRQIPFELDRVVRYCLEKNPDERFQSARDLAFALKMLSKSSGLWQPAATGKTQAKKGRKKGIDSIAILPFTNASADPDTEYLVDGITENIINTLSQLPRLRVMASSTVFRYKDRVVDPQQAGIELGVRAVLTGKVVQRGETLFVQTELVDVADGSQLWGGQYHQELRNLMQVQEEIARHISEKLRGRLQAEEKKRLSKKYTQNTEAYRLYLKGRFEFNKRSEEGMLKAIDYFQQAVEEDQHLALAHAGLADAFGMLGGYGFVSPTEGYTKARAEALQALQNDPTSSEAHTSLAVVKYRFDWAWAEAEIEFRQAIQFNPGYVTAHHWYGVYLAMMGRWQEAFAEIQKGLDIDPLSRVINWTLGYMFYYNREYDRAIEQLQKTLSIDPTFLRVHTDIGLALLQKEQYDEGIAEIRRAMVQSERNPSYMAPLAYAYGRAGDRNEALRILDEVAEIAKRRFVTPYHFAIIYTGLGDRELAFEWLEKAFAEREDALVSLKINPRFDPLRPDPRFADLLRRIGLP